MWILMNTSNNQVVATRVGRADSYMQRLVGLLGRKSLASDEGLWIEPCDSIHTFFMRFAIDVAFVDASGTVIRRIDALKPWRATRIHSKAAACVELAPGTLQQAKVEVGSRLALLREGS